MVERARRKDLFQYGDLNKQQLENNTLNTEEMERSALQLNSYPRRLVLELTNVCNLNCIMCGRDSKKFTPTFFDLNSLDKIKTVLNTITEVTLFGWGEPTMHPKLSNILEYLNQYPVKKYFVTNGMLLHNFIEDIFRYHVDIIAISLDGACSETNDKIRAKGKFEQVVENIKMIVKRRHDLGITSPYINFVMTLMKDNIEELPKMVSLAHNLGIEEVKAVYLTAFNEEMAKRTLYNETDTVRRIFAKTLETGEKHKIKVKLPFVQGDDIAKDLFHKNCYVSWRDFFLGADGYVRPCQSTPMKLFAYDKYENFNEMWNSPEYINIRKRVNDQEKMPQECKVCYQSSHANWNRKSSFIHPTDGVDYAPTWERK